MNKIDGIEAVSEHGDELETLQALRRKVAQTLDMCESARDIAALSRQLQQIVARIREIEANRAVYGDEIDRIVAAHKHQRVRSGARKRVEELIAADRRSRNKDHE